MIRRCLVSRRTCPPVSRQCGTGGALRSAAKKTSHDGGLSGSLFFLNIKSAVTLTPNPVTALRTVAVAALLLLAAPAFSHDAPSGWAYPISCCSDFDCREVADAAILERPEGYVIAATGELIPYGDRKVRDAPDGVFHWCSVGGREDSKTICLFVPPRGF